MALVAGAFAATYVAVAIADPGLFMTVDGTDLGNSVASADDEYMAVPDPCERIGHDRWTCAVETDPGSGISGTVRVRMTSETCWVRTNAPRSQPLRGCVGFADFMTPW